MFYIASPSRGSAESLFADCKLSPTRTVGPPDHVSIRAQMRGVFAPSGSLNTSAATVVFWRTRCRLLRHYPKVLSVLHSHEASDGP